MELKSGYYQGNSGDLYGFNRTFMELKSLGGVYEWKMDAVLIVPLWN